MILTSRACRYSCSLGEVSRIHLVQGCSEFFQASHICICEFTFFIWWNIEEEWRSTTNRFEVDIHQIFDWFWLLIVMVEPTWTNRNVCFTDWVHISFWVSMVEIFVLHIVSDFSFLNLMPNWISSDTTFITDPTDACWLSREDSDIPFSFLDVLEPLVKGVSYFLSSATTRTIHPYFDEFTIISVFRIAEDFLELVEIVFVILFFSWNMIFRVISIPWW